MSESFDYEILHRCQYEIDGGDCGEPATHRVWWDDFGRDAMLVCKDHFEFIKRTETKVEED